MASALVSISVNKQTNTNLRFIDLYGWNYQHALKGQKLLAQGSALGIKAVSKAPCKGKSFVYCPVF